MGEEKFPKLNEQQQKRVDSVLNNMDQHFVYLCKLRGIPLATQSRIEHDFKSLAGSKLWKIAHAYDERKRNWKSHLYTTLDRVLIDALRQHNAGKKPGRWWRGKYRRLGSLETLEMLLGKHMPPEPEIEDLQTLADRAKAVHEAIEQLEEPRKGVIRRYMENAAYKDIAQEYGTTKSRIHNWIQSAKATLRRKLIKDPRIAVEKPR